MDFVEDIPGSDQCSLAAYESNLMCGDTLIEDEQTIQITLHMHQPYPYGYGLGDSLIVSQVSGAIYGHDVPPSECKPKLRPDKSGSMYLYHCSSRSVFENPRGFAIKIKSVESEWRSVTTELELLLPPGIDPYKEPRLEIDGDDIRVIFYKKDA